MSRLIGGILNIIYEGLFWGGSYQRAAGNGRSLLSWKRHIDISEKIRKAPLERWFKELLKKVESSA